MKGVDCMLPEWMDQIQQVIELAHRGMGQLCHMAVQPECWALVQHSHMGLEPDYRFLFQHGFPSHATGAWPSTATEC